MIPKVPRVSCLCAEWIALVCVSRLPMQLQCLHKHNAANRTNINTSNGARKLKQQKIAHIRNQGNELSRLWNVKWLMQSSANTPNRRFRVCSFGRSTHEKKTRQRNSQLEKESRRSDEAKTNKEKIANEHAHPLHEDSCNGTLHANGHKSNNITSPSARNWWKSWNL